VGGIYRRRPETKPVEVTITVSGENMRMLRGRASQRQMTVERIIESMLARELAVERVSREKDGYLASDRRRGMRGNQNPD